MRGAHFTSAGAHFNPANKKHGLQNPEGPHAGDMPNFTVAANGTAKTTVTNKNVTMGAGANSIYADGGTALVIHAGADDMKTDPSGNAGDRSPAARSRSEAEPRCAHPDRRVRGRRDAGRRACGESQPSPAPAAQSAPASRRRRLTRRMAPVRLSAP